MASFFPLILFLFGKAKLCITNDGALSYMATEIFLSKQDFFFLAKPY